MNLQIDINGQIVEKGDPFYEFYMGTKDPYVYVSDDFIEAVKPLKKGDELLVTVFTNGGNVDAGILMYNTMLDLRAKGVKVTTKNMGKQHSIGHVIALGGEIRQGFNSSVGLVHLPRVGSEYFWQFGAGVSVEDLRQLEDELVTDENRILDIYVEATGGNKEALRKIMYNERTLNASQLKNLNFFTEIIEGAALKDPARVNNLVYTNNFKINFMEKKPAAKTANASKGVFAGCMAKINAQLAKVGNLLVDNLDYETEEGTPLHVEREEGDPEVGDNATIGDTNETDGTVTLTDGRTVVVAAGVITEINDAPTENTEDAENLAAVTAENAELVATNKVLLETVNVLKTEIGNIQAELENLGSIHTNYKAPTRSTTAGAGKAAPGKPAASNSGFEQGALTRKHNPKKAD